jgi:molybdopterin molybdotransferase
VSELLCWRKPRVALLATGDELVEPGTARSNDGTIPESISVGIAALVRDYGGQIVSQSRLPDDLELMEKAVAEVLETADLIITTGGASVGERDFAKQMFEPAGLELIFSKVAMKPGKPVWLGRAAGRLVLGLPGNPTSALATGRLLLAPLVAGLAGEVSGTCLRWREVEIASDLPAVGDRETFVRAFIDDQGRALPLGKQFSSAQHALADADLLLRRPAGLGSLDAGEVVQAIDF